MYLLGFALISTGKGEDKYGVVGWILVKSYVVPTNNDMQVPAPHKSNIWHWAPETQTQSTNTRTHTA